MRLLILLAFFAGSVLLATRLAAAWQETQRREAYLPELEAMARRSPYDARLLVLLGGRLLEAGEYPAAIETLRRGIAAGEADSAVWLNLAAARAARGDIAYALAGLTLARKKDPKSPALQAALVRARMLGRSPAPDALARALCPEGPAVLVAERARGSFLNGLAQWWGRRYPEKSGFATRQARAGQEPENAEAQRLWGAALLRNRRPLEAMAVLTRAVALAPRSAEANLALANAFEDAGLDSKAMVQYVACLKLRPDWLPALLGFGRASTRADAPKHAIAAFQQATKIAPASADAWIGLGRAGFALPSHYAQSLAAFQTAVRLAPARTDFYADYAIALRQSSRMNPGESGRLKEAESVLRQRLAAAPQDAFARYLLANVLLQGPASPAAEAEAEAETRRALDLEPGNPIMETQLGKLLLHRGDAPGATEHLSRALEADPKSAPTLALLARAYKRQGQNALAERASREATLLNNTNDQIKRLQERSKANLMDAGVHEQLAKLYERMAMRDKARFEQDMAALIRKDPREAARQLKAVTGTIQSVLKEP